MTRPVITYETTAVIGGRVVVVEGVDASRVRAALALADLLDNGGGIRRCKTTTGYVAWRGGTNDAYGVTWIDAIDNLTTGTTTTPKEWK